MSIRKNYRIRNVLEVTFYYRKPLIIGVTNRRGNCTEFNEHLRDEMKGTYV